jgi:hypothetical protein
LAPKHDSVGILEDGGDIRVGQKSFFTSKIQEVLPRFVVLSSNKILQKTVFENLSEWQKSMNEDFSIL